MHSFEKPSFGESTPFSAPNPNANRRTHRRAELSADVSLYSETNFWSGLTEDVSEGGLFIATWHEYPLGTQIDLKFELPNSHVVSARGEVRWHRDESEHFSPGVGIRFTDLREEDLAQIQAFIRHRSPLLYDE